MSKNIVICSDGTGNTAMKGRGTNVFKLFEAVDIHLDNPRQVALYDDGVGTQSFNPIKLLSGAIGLGLKKNVIQLYTELAHLYNPGDRIYLFGFSRGAFTVRTLGGLIYQCGVLDHDCVNEEELRRRAKAAYRAFRCRKLALLDKVICTLLDIVTLGRCCRKEKLSKVRKEYALKNEGFSAHENTVEKIIPPITMIGVWDTVSAMGFPVKEVSDFINTFIYRFKFENHDLGKNVEHAYHALSIDDERRTFHPLMWNEDDETRSKIEQVWFAGVHANVGGGYPKHGMSLVTMDWMIHKASNNGLVLNQHDKELFVNHRNVNDKLYDSRSGIKSIYRYTPRNSGKLCKAHGVKPLIHLSVFRRIAQSTEGYAPGNIPNDLEVVENTGVTNTSGSVQRLIRDQLGAASSLLSRVTFLVNVRIGFHILMLVLLTAMLVLYLRDSADEGGCWSVMLNLFSIDGLIDLLKFTVKNYWWLLACVIAMYVTSGLAERRMKTCFSEFYYRFIKNLRKLFELTNENV